jgi:hypothetical protein
VLRRPSLLGLVYLIVGVVIAAQRGYLEGIGGLEGLLSALLAILLWPLLLLGIDLHVDL